MPEIKQKIRKEINDLKSKHNDLEDWNSVLTYDNLLDLKYLTLCINESLRIAPPAHYSTELILTENSTIGTIKIRKDTPFLIHIYHLHHNKKEW